MKKIKEQERYDSEYDVVNPQFEEEMRKAKQRQESKRDGQGDIDILEVDTL